MIQPTATFRPNAKYGRIAQELIERINAGRYPVGAQLPTEQDFADEFEVNALTVRKALGLLQDEGLISREQGRGTFVKDSFTRQGGICYVGHMKDDLERVRHSALLAAAQRRGLQLSSITPVEESGMNDAWRSMLRAQVDAASTVVVHDKCYRLIKPFAADIERLVIIGEDGVEQATGAIQVLTDRAMAVRLAVQHAVQLGHRRIALAVGALLRPHLESSRRKGAQWTLYKDDEFAFRETCRTLTGEPPILLEINIDQEDQGVESAVASLGSTSPRPTAIVCDMDYTARAFYIAAQRHELRIPTDLGIIGLGDTSWARCLAPELTSMNLCDAELAEAAVRFCQDPPASGATYRIQPRLKARASLLPLAKMSDTARG